VLAWYRDTKGPLAEIDALGSVDEVTARMRKAAGLP
jgi:hypothetical protein